MNSTLTRLAGVTALLVATASPCAAQSQPGGFGWTVLQQFDQGWWARDLNNAGQVVGMALTTSGYQAFIWDAGRTTLVPGYRSSDAFAINDRGEVFGTGHHFLGDRGSYFIHSGGQTRELGLARSSSPTEVMNNRGDVAGTIANPHYDAWSYGFVHRNGTTSIIDVGQAHVSLADMSDAGLVVGHVRNRLSHPEPVGFMWRDNVRTDLPLVATGVNEAGIIIGRGAAGELAYNSNDGSVTRIADDVATEVRPQDINEAGAIVGSAVLEGHSSRHAFLFDGTRLRDLGTLGGSWSEALRVNDRGDVLGVSETSTGYSNYFFYRDGQMHNVSAWLSAAGRPSGVINEQLAQMNEDGTLLLQTDSVFMALAVSPIPEPTTTAMMAGGLFALAGWARRRRGGLRAAC
jgi:probable HAF family extracellular repeat protein